MQVPVKARVLKVEEYLPRSARRGAIAAAPTDDPKIPAAMNELGASLF